MTSPAPLKLADPFADLAHFVARDAPLAKLTWYGVGGPARYLVRPRTLDDLRAAAQRCADTDTPVFVLGLGANLLVRDEGVPGAVFVLDAPAFRDFELMGGNRVRVGAGHDLAKLILKTVRAGRAGLEGLAGIPGTVGGATRMNAGGRFGDFGTRVEHVTVMDARGELSDLSHDDARFAYRRCGIAQPFVTSVVLQLDEDDPDALMRRCKEAWMYKRTTQPLSARSCGCVFKNPPGGSAGGTIDGCGLKGLRVGGAEVSPRHANFIVAHDGATAADVLRLATLVQERVRAARGVELELEMKVWPDVA